MQPMMLSSTQISPALKLGGSTRGLVRRKTMKRMGFEKPLNVPAIKHGKEWEWLSIERAKSLISPGFPGAKWIKPAIVMDWEDPVCCSPDAMFHLEGYDKLFGLEVKTPYSRQLPSKPEDVQMEHLLQCFACLQICRANEWFLFYYSVSLDEGVLFSVLPDKDLWKEEIVPRVRKFLEDPERALEKLPPGSLVPLRTRLRSTIKMLRRWP